jgi:crotonobetainyl-CoA:carnitine CoA-transferase CaiB-like acyl-CoA transferase
MTTSTPGVLDDIRVIEVCGPIGHYAGRLLADLGADVIKVEPIEGDEARRWPPFLPGVEAPENALQFILLNANKRSVRLDLATQRGRDLFLRLLGSAAVLLDSWQPHESAALGLTEDVLLEAKPDLIRASVTGWGLSGPRAGAAYADIVGQAMSGVMQLAGFPEGPPEQIGDLQGYHCASIDAAAGVMAAVLQRDATGEGQRVEVSMQEALSMAQETAMMTTDILRTNRERTGGITGGLRIPGVGLYEAADGYVYTLAAGLAGSGFQGVLLLMDELGFEHDLREEPYATFIRESMNRALLLQAAQDPTRLAGLQEKLSHIDELLTAFLSQHPKRVLYERGQAHRLLIGVVSTPQDISESPQLNARDWFVEIDDPKRGRRLRYPGPPWQLRGTPATLRRPAPLLGEHNAEVFADLGVPPEQIEALAGGEVAR